MLMIFLVATSFEYFCFFLLFFGIFCTFFILSASGFFQHLSCQFNLTIDTSHYLTSLLELLTSQRVGWRNLEDFFAFDLF